MKLKKSAVHRWISVSGIGVAALILTNPVAGQVNPDARAHHQLVHHAGDGKVYLTGGSTRRGNRHHYFNDVWSWDGSAWSLGAALFPRSSHRIVYHDRRNSLILFGGGFAQALRAEGIIWERRPDGWQALDGSFRAAATEPGMCYDRRRERVVIFGGWDAAGSFRGDTWEWSEAGFVRVDSAGPSPRAGHGFVYDAVRERCLVSADAVRKVIWQTHGTGMVEIGMSWKFPDRLSGGSSERHNTQHSSTAFGDTQR